MYFLLHRYQHQLKVSFFLSFYVLKLRFFIALRHCLDTILVAFKKKKSVCIISDIGFVYHYPCLNKNREI